MSDPLAELFPDGDYRFHLTLRRTQPGEFLRPRDHSGRVLAERARWLAADPERYATLLPEGEAALREFAAMASAWIPTLGAAELATSSASQILHLLGRTLDADVLFLSADQEGQFRLRGGVLCFPTGWALSEKLGGTMDFIHGVVPGLNTALGAPIHQFLSKLKPGVEFLRHNWGITASDELNLHPSRGIAPPDVPIKLDGLWLRVEHQALLALPDSRGIVFGIRIALHRLDVIAGGPHSKSLRRALETMPAELVSYKRLERVRDHLLNVL
jgi:dimethylamine monooxygenase subunit A